MKLLVRFPFYLKTFRSPRSVAANYHESRHLSFQPHKQTLSGHHKHSLIYEPILCLLFFHVILDLLRNDGSLFYDKYRNNSIDKMAARLIGKRQA